ncbi:MAG: HesA/MoeB/ThiF family protein [Candidatus Thermoplasmatota archaeon]|jgi:molybdopterin/thiamine biosynthesis adenylyltransferase|nr:HesA/MoeB/ThiF family protein [Candidatus Thermoplasmatota archaeon]MCL5785380.1 HesA/MoeB/ThiF family protein [Candidatus Thermoplasmatota archaeon]
MDQVNEKTSIIRPRLKLTHNPFRGNDNKILVGRFFPIADILQDDSESSVWNTLKMLDGTRTVEELIRDANGFLDRESVTELLAVLIKRGHIEEGDPSALKHVNPNELERYSRNMDYLSLVDPFTRNTPFFPQERLKASRVAILGLGGVGSTVALSLAASGIGDLRIADFDIVEYSNLTRQVLYDEDDVGRKKVDAAVEKLKKVNSRLEISGVELKVGSYQDITGMMEGSSLFVSAADQPHEKIEEWCNRAALETGIPWMTSSYQGALIHVSGFVPYVTPCFECDIHQRNEERETGENMFLNDKFPAIGPVSSIAAQILSLEAIRFLCDMPSSIIGRQVIMNTVKLDETKYREFGFWDSCPACSSGRSVQEARSRVVK